MVSLQPIEAVQLGDLAFDSIRTAIVTVALQPGEPVRDRELAEVLKLSRTPVREALHRLEAAGLIETRGRGGWIVSPFRERDVRELFELRRLLEPAGLDRLEREPDPQAVSTIVHFFDDYAHPIVSEQFTDYFSRDHAFHTFLVSCSRNTRLQSIYSNIENHIVRGRNYLSSSAEDRVDATLDEHEAVAHAVGEGDFAAARKLLVEHLRTGEERMVEQLRHKERLMREAED